MFVIEQFATLIAEKVQAAHYGEGGNIFLNKLPDANSEDVVCLTQYMGDSSFVSAHDDIFFQARIRGHDLDDSLSGYRFAHDIWAGVHGWTRELPLDSEHVIDCISAAGLPQSDGYDEQDRPEWLIDFIVTARMDIPYRSYT